jgi:hypothetical protein
MYGKHFESMYEGSMYGAGINVFAVWGWVISHARGERVEINPKKLADTLGGRLEDIQAAIDFLGRPDPHSRHKGHEGRRLVKEGEFQYFLPSWDKYQDMKSEADRREYNRLKQREYRTIKRGTPLPGEAAAVKAFRNGDEAEFDRLTSVREHRMTKEDFEALAKKERLIEKLIEKGGDNERHANGGAD